MARTRTFLPRVISSCPREYYVSGRKGFAHRILRHETRNTAKIRGLPSPRPSITPSLPQHQRDARPEKSRQDTVAEWKEKVATLSELAAETEELKRTLRAGRGPRTKILEASERLRGINDQLATTRRFLEPLVTSCPFCLWTCEPLFITDAGAGLGELNPYLPDLGGRQ